MKDNLIAASGNKGPELASFLWEDPLLFENSINEISLEKSELPTPTPEALIKKSFILLVFMPPVGINLVVWGKTDE